MDNLTRILFTKSVAEPVVILKIQKLRDKKDLVEIEERSNKLTLMYLSLVLNSLSVVLNTLRTHSLGTLYGSSASSGPGPPSAWKMTASFPVEMTPLTLSRMPPLTSLYSNTRVFGSKA